MFGIPSPIIFAGIGIIAFGIYTAVIWDKATGYANDAWTAKNAAATEQVRQEQAAKNRKTEEALRVLVDVQTKAREAAEAETEELRNALAADQTDATVTVGPDLDRLFCRAVGGGRGNGPCANPGG